MKESYLITVYSNRLAYEKKKPVFARNLYFDKVGYFDFAGIVSSMRVLFGCSCIVVFELQILDDVDK